jgi:hypothetical protein
MAIPPRAFPSRGWPPFGGTGRITPLPMSKTNRAKFAQWRLHTLHEAYLRRVDEIREVPSRLRLQRRYFAALCPYCGQQDGLCGTAKVGSKRVVRDIALTEEGFEVGDSGNRNVILTVVDCKTCGAHVEPEAYHSPIWFAGDRMATLEALEEYRDLLD